MKQFQDSLWMCASTSVMTLFGFMSLAIAIFDVILILLSGAHKGMVEGSEWLGDLAQNLNPANHEDKFEAYSRQLDAEQAAEVR